MLNASSPLASASPTAAGLHWVLYAGAIVPAAIGLAGALGSSLMPSGTARSGLLLIATLALAAGVLQLLATWARIQATEIVVTNRRVIYKTGLLTRRSIEMNLDKVESVVVDQSLPGRMLDFGTVIIRGVGAGLEPVVNVAAPLEFRRQVSGP
jgi:uncharacterized membrane protein YdbT with pleckstrin-like domain